MNTPNQLGSLPEWYEVLDAAEKLHCPPWELLEQPVAWMEWAQIKSAADGRVREKLQERDERRQKRKGKMGRR